MSESGIYLGTYYDHLGREYVQLMYRDGTGNDRFISTYSYNGKTEVKLDNSGYASGLDINPPGASNFPSVKLDLPANTTNSQAWANLTNSLSEANTANYPGDFTSGALAIHTILDKAGFKNIDNAVLSNGISMNKVSGFNPLPLSYVV
jgi:hypothetical protein